MDTTDADYIGCGELLPHNEYGSITKAYFFASGDPAPESLQLGASHFDTARFRPVASYIKGEDGLGQITKF